MNAVIIDDEKESVLTFTNAVIDIPNISLNVFSNKCEELLSYARSHQVDVAFLDIVMPKINGIELAKKLIDINQAIKIVLITGYAQDIEAIKRELKDNLFEFCYKPYDEERIHEILARLLNQDKMNVSFKTFPRFDMYVNGVHVDFERAKSKEFLAILVDHRGGEVTLDEAITKLWVDKEPELAKRLYRDAISRLRMKLNEYGISNLVDFARGRARLNCSNVSCDYWDYLDGNKTLFKGEYMRPYEWAAEIEDSLKY